MAPSPISAPQPPLALGTPADRGSCRLCATLRESPTVVTEKLRVGCQSVDECRSIALEAEVELEACAVSCKQEQSNYAHARRLLRRALEQQAEAAHTRDAQQRQNEEVRRAKLAEQEAKRQQQELRVAEALAHQRQLELITAKAKAAEVARLAEEKRKLSYLRQLTRAQRLERLRHCHKTSANCDPTAARLVLSAASKTEQAVLVAQHEAWRARSVTPAIAKPAKSRQAQKSSPKKRGQPVQCCDGTIAIGCHCGANAADCCSAQGGACGCAG